MGEPICMVRLGRKSARPLARFDAGQNVRIEKHSNENAIPSAPPNPYASGESSSADSTSFSLLQFPATADIYRLHPHNPARFSAAPLHKIPSAQYAAPPPAES